MRIAFANTMLGDITANAVLRKHYAASVAGNGYAHAFELLTSGNPLGASDINSISQVLAHIGILDSSNAMTLKAFKTMKF